MADTKLLTKAFAPEVLEAIGLLFVAAAAAEQALALQMARLIAHPNPLDLPTSVAIQRAEIHVRLRQLDTLFFYKVPKPYRDEARTICDQLKDAFARRNDFAHYLVSPSGSDQHRVVLKTLKLSKDKLEKDKSYNVHEIKEFADRIVKLNHRLDEILNAAGIARLSIQLPTDAPKPGG